jgi:hypothetical protein
VLNIISIVSQKYASEKRDENRLLTKDEKTASADIRSGIMIQNNPIRIRIARDIVAE